MYGCSIYSPKSIRGTRKKKHFLWTTIEGKQDGHVWGAPCQNNGSWPDKEKGVKWQWRNAHVSPSNDSLTIPPEV